MYYIHPIYKLSTGSTTSKANTQKFALSQKGRVLMKLSVNRPRGILSSSNTLPLCSLQMLPKMTCEEPRPSFSLS